MDPLNCRFCNNSLNHSFVDLGFAPLSNSFLKSEDLNREEVFYPLIAYVCEECFLVQLPEFETPEKIFNDYAYFSSYSETWLEHSKTYTDKMVQRFGFNQDSQVIEIASNDGYLLAFFKQKGIPVLGIEPAGNVAEVAKNAGIATEVKFFNSQTASELVAMGKHADLLLGNNVLAHVPDINDFVRGLKVLLKSQGVITMEFPHIVRLIDGNQFDTIYHEHFYYFSFFTVQNLFAKYGLSLFDVENLSTHGGSLRIYGKHLEDKTKPISSRVNEMKEMELDLGFNKIETYKGFSEKVKKTKYKLLNFLINEKGKGKTIVGYGAPAKGNTLLNYCGIRTNFIDYTVDRNPYKQGRFLPGTHIPIYQPENIMETKPNYLLILPWNLKDEIIEQMAHIRDWGGKFVIPIPEVEVID